MDLTIYAEELRQGLLVAADAGGDEARELAERLLAPLQSATRLILLDVLAAAAAEITSEIAPGSVEVRLRGRDPEFVVNTVVDDAATVSPTPAEGPTAADTYPDTGDADDAATARGTLRLPEPLKLRIEDAASREGLSVNAWLVRKLAAVIDAPQQHGRAAPTTLAGGQRFTGWARS